MTERICEICEQPFYPKHGNQKYCSDECVREARRLNTQKCRLRWYNLYGKADKSMRKGTSGLGQTPEADFMEEYRLIQKEKARIGL